MRTGMSVILSIMLLGCGPEQSTKDPSQPDWQSRTLTEAENMRLEELLEEVHWGIVYDSVLNGKPASDYSELLSLADRTCIRGSETIYGYDVISSGDVNDPDEMTIVVVEGTIKYADWPYYDY